MKKDKEWLKENVGITMELSGDSGIFYSPNMSRILYDDLVELIDQLDEPEQVVIPQFVADWFEKHKNRGLSSEIFSLVIDVNEDSDNISDELRDWVDWSANKAIETLVEMKKRLHNRATKTTNSHRERLR